jgi:hypothetical protein
MNAWESNLFACTYNAAVNYGSSRAHKKMMRLIEALNLYERAKGKEKLKILVKKGIIETYKSCPDECCIKPGGLFHAKGCENDPNHPVYRERQQKAKELLPGGKSGHDGWHASNVTLVGS